MVFQCLPHQEGRQHQLSHGAGPHLLRSRERGARAKAGGPSPWGNDQGNLGSALITEPVLPLDPEATTALMTAIGTGRLYPTLPAAVDGYRRWARDHPGGASPPSPG